MDGDLLQTWFDSDFLSAVRARTTLPVALISDNCGAHDKLESDQVKFISVAPNCTSVFQPLDSSIFACLTRR